MGKTTYNAVPKLAVLLLTACLVPACSQPSQRTNTHRPYAARSAAHSGNEPLSAMEFATAYFPHLRNKRYVPRGVNEQVESAYATYLAGFNLKLEADRVELERQRLQLDRDRFEDQRRPDASVRPLTANMQSRNGTAL